MLVIVFQYKEWYFLWLVIFYGGFESLKKNYSNVAVYFWNVLNHFLKVREFSFWILDFLDDEVDLETNIDCVEFVKSTAGLEFNHRDFTFWFWFLIFGTFWYCLGQWYCTLANQDTSLVFLAWGECFTVYGTQTDAFL